jgi:hypothetical protein
VAVVVLLLQVEMVVHHRVEMVVTEDKFLKCLHLMEVQLNILVVVVEVVEMEDLVDLVDLED